MSPCSLPQLSFRRPRNGRGWWYWARVRAFYEQALPERNQKKRAGMKYGDCSELASWPSRRHLQPAGTHTLSCTFSFFKNASSLLGYPSPRQLYSHQPTGWWTNNNNNNKKGSVHNRCRFGKRHHWIIREIIIITCILQCRVSLAFLTISALFWFSDFYYILHSFCLCVCVLETLSIQDGPSDLLHCGAGLSVLIDPGIAFALTSRIYPVLCGLFTLFFSFSLAWRQCLDLI